MDAEEVVRGVYTAFSTGDQPKLAELLAQDIDWYESEGLPWGGYKKGFPAVAQEVFGPTMALLPDIRIEPEDVYPSGDTVAVVHRYRSESAGLDLLGSGVWDVSDGQVVRYRQFVDTAVFRRSLPDDA